MNRFIVTFSALAAMGGTLGVTPALAQDGLSFSPQTLSSRGGAPDWTGAYVGGQVGWAGVDTNIAGRDGDDVIGGLVAGYDHDLGNWVIGGGLDYDFADINLGGGTTLDNVFRAKLRGGYKLGDGLIYATGGWAQAETSNLGSDDGYFIGAGYEQKLTENFSVGGEVLYHDFNNFNGTTTDVEATTVQLRGIFRF